MIGFLVRRIGLAILSIWMVSVLSFAIIQITPIDPAQNRGALGAFRRLPAHEQYVQWIGSIARGNLGRDLVGRRVPDVIGERLGMTVVLSLGTVLIVWAVALPVGIYSAMRPYTRTDAIVRALSYLGFAIPNLLFALVLLYIGVAVFGARIGDLFSPAYMSAPWTFERVGDLLAHLPIPLVVLAIGGTAQLVRLMRSNLLDELRMPYVVAARARGLSERRTVLRYPVRVALNPFASTVGFLLPEIVSGSVLVSIILSLPTLGPTLLESLLAGDVYLGGTLLLLLGSLTIVGMLLSDLLLMWLDPRTRRAKRS